MYRLNLVAYGKAPHHLVDLDFDSVADTGISHKDHKSLDSGNAIALACNVLNIDIVLSPSLYRSWSAHRGPICIIICQLHHCPSRKPENSFVLVLASTPDY